MNRTLIVIFALCCFTHVAEAQKQKDINEALQIEIQSLQRKVDSLERIYWKNEAKIAALESTIDKLSSFFSEQTDALVKKLGELTANNQVAEKPYEIIGNYGSSFYDNTYHADRLLVRHGAYFGFIDRSGNIAIPCEYDDVWPFNDNGFAWIKKNGTWGIINTDGEEVTACKYDDPREFHKVDNVWDIIVIKDGKEGVLLLPGAKEPIPAQYDDVRRGIWRHQTHQFIVEKDGKYGVVDISGKVILKTIYSYITEKGDEYGVSETSGDWYYSKEGQRLRKW